MKKILFASLFSAAAMMGLSSCMNGDYDANPVTTNSGTNPLNPNGSSGGGSGGGNSGSASYYSWSGTDPMSAKVDGTAAQATSAQVIEASGTTLVQSGGAGISLQVAFPTSTAPGTVMELTSSSPAFVTAGGYTSATGSGGLYVIENDATHCKGKFFATVKDISGGGAKQVTEGWFNATK